MGVVETETVDRFSCRELEELELDEDLRIFFEVDLGAVPGLIVAEAEAGTGQISSFVNLTKGILGSDDM